jgi:homoserine dehydrogenase
MRRLRIGLIGWGTVGSALGELIVRGPPPIELASVAVRDPSRARTRALPSGVRIGSVEDALAADVVVELAGGEETALPWARATLAAGRPYVTANKALLATHGAELAELAAANGAALLASASVGGGTPMLETVEHLAATNEVARLRGILNATTTFITTALGRSGTYDDALAEAQAAGYAEADPTFDVSGRDAAQKLAILASVAWGRWRTEREVETTGIVGLTVEAGSTVRLMADATPDRLAVGPMELASDDPLAAVEGIGNMLAVEVAGAGTFTVSGPGAGGRVTAGAVYADLVRLVRGERPILGGASRKVDR